MECCTSEKKTDPCMQFAMVLYPLYNAKLLAEFSTILDSFLSITEALYIGWGATKWHVTAELSNF